MARHSVPSPLTLLSLSSASLSSRSIESPRHTYIITHKNIHTATTTIVAKPGFGLSMSSAAAWNGETDLMFTIKEESLLAGHVILVTVFALGVGR